MVRFTSLLTWHSVLLRLYLRNSSCGSDIVRVPYGENKKLTFAFHDHSKERPLTSAGRSLLAQWTQGYGILPRSIRMRQRSALRRDSMKTVTTRNLM